MIVGCLALAYGATVYFWKDPVTDVWAMWKQRGLASELDQSFAEFRATPRPSSRPQPARPRRASAAPPASLPRSPPPSRARLPRAGRHRRPPGGRRGRPSLPGGRRGRRGARTARDPGARHRPDRGERNRVGTRSVAGAGLYPESKLPGTGRVTAIAGHRTTFGAWFRHIDDLEAGDPISLVLPYGTFRYTVVEHEIVDDGDWSILAPRLRTRHSSSPRAIRSTAPPSAGSSTHASSRSTGPTGRRCASRRRAATARHAARPASGRAARRTRARRRSAAGARAERAGRPRRRPGAGPSRRGATRGTSAAARR